MKSKFLISVLLIIIILIGGYCYLTTLTVIHTPPMISKAPPSLNVYGKLVDYTQNNGLTVFKIQSEIVNWELNNSYLEIESKPQLFYNFTDNYLTCIEQNWYPTEQECKNHFYQENNLSEKCKSMTELPEKGIFYVKCDVKFELIEGDNYVFYFAKVSNAEGPWNIVIISENLTEYKQNGARNHQNDLTSDQMITTREEEGELKPGQQRVAQIIPTTIITSELTELEILLINKQDNDLKYRMTNASIVDYLVYLPFLNPAEEKYMNQPQIDIRLSNAIIKNCNVEYDDSKQIIKSNSNETLSFFVMCNEPIVKQRTYISCDIHGENCKNVTTKTEFLLWGEMEFTDELDNKHTKGVLKQFLEIK